MIVVCAWHLLYYGQQLTIGEIAPYDNHDTTHGMCVDCSRKLKEEYFQKKEKQNENRI